ncbi:MAG: hypothetical protein U1F61_17045 [Opitutaceae bacterium]
MPSTMPRLDGRRLLEAAKHEYSWHFTFSDGASIITESSWRLLSKDGVAVTSEDDGQLFGLKEPINACARVIAAVGGRKITECRLEERTSDLSVHFGDDVSVQFLTMSCGFESWRARIGSEEIICTGGGGVSFFTRETRGG